MDEIERTLDATDHFLQNVICDENRLRDADFMSNLSQLRQQHKKTFSIIESLYNDYGNYARPLSTNEYDADVFDYCNRGYLGERRSKSVQSLLHSCECWQEERTVQFTEEEWIPQITVPKPFQMTLRDEKAPIKASYSQKFIKELTEKKKEEMRESVEATNKLRCKAREVPRSTYEPIYEQMLIDMERAREERHRRAAQMVERSRRPFSALTTSTTNFHMRRCASAEASEWEKRETFKANEVPMSVYLPPYKDEIQAALRAKARTQRAIKLIQASKAPTGMQERALRAKVQNHIRHNRVCNGESPIPVLPPSKTVPDFKSIHQRLADKLEKAPVRPTTIATPFHFESDHRVHAHHCKDDLTTKSRPPRRSFSVSNLSESAAYNVRLNHASLLRNEAIRMRMRKMEDEKNRSRNFWKTVNEENRISRQRLKQKLAAEEYVNDEIRRKLDEKRKEQMIRTKQYRRELEAMNRRLMGRALILEQQEMLIEKQRFEKKYEESMAKVRAGAKKVTFKESSAREKVTDYGSSTTSSSSRKSLLKAEEGNGGDEYNSSFETDTGDVGDSDVSDADTATLSDDKLSKISEHSEKTMSSSSSSRSTSTA